MSDKPSDDEIDREVAALKHQLMPALQGQRAIVAMTALASLLVEAARMVGTTRKAFIKGMAGQWDHRAAHEARKGML